MSDEQPRLHGVELRYSSVSVFDQPNTQSRELRRLHQGEPFEVLSKEPVLGPEGDFSRVRLADGTVGFVYAPNLTGPVRPLSGEERALAYQPAPLRTGRSATIPFLFNPLAVEEWQLWTPLTLAQCQERLQAELIAGGSGSWFGFDDTSGAYSVRGKVSVQGFSIQKPHASRSWYVPTRAAGRFLPGADGTHLTVRLGINAVQIAPGLVSIPVGLAIFWTSGRVSEFWLALILLISIGGYFLGRWLARAEGRFLLDFLVETLRVEERPLPSNPGPR